MPKEQAIQSKSTRLNRLFKQAMHLFCCLPTSLSQNQAYATKGKSRKPHHEVSLNPVSFVSTLGYIAPPQLFALPITTETTSMRMLKNFPGRDKEQQG